MTLGPKEIKWRAPEFEYFHKGIGWYWLVILVSALVVILSIWRGNFLFALFIVIAAFLILFWGQRQPREVEFELNERGFEIDNKKFYPYNSFLGFDIHPGNDEWEEIVFHSKNRLTPYLKAMIDKTRVSEAETLINRFIPKIECEASLVDHISKWLRF